MRVTSEFWVTAYIRKCFAAGAFAGILKRGATEAGAIFVSIDRLDGTYDLFGPAPQSFFAEEKPLDREFEQLLSGVDRFEIITRLEKEARMDDDFWQVEVEDKEGRHFLEIAKDGGI
ncbi:DUF1491 family protein [Pseudovibrio exalbescens]|uniref:DUF1491 family protein n=1 Tax=Pseudovibrio exalbescens TaxID=197461 RepID=UPI002365B399|nr:DUF1491 family protein [Pseudovibrio exalbescens]MDD7909160.1 DUF1491 family protein [Pseudovibrio exalbescens]